MHSFCHAGDIGDVIYGLYVMKRLGGGELLLGTDSGLGEFQPRVGITMPIYNVLVTLLRLQPCCRSTTWLDHVPFVHEQRNLNRFRLFWQGKWHFGKQYKNVHLIEMMCRAASIEFVDEGPWLEAACRHEYPVIVSRSARQRDHKFPWPDVLARYKGKVAFVGLPCEYEVFSRMFGRIPYVQTHMLLALAEVIQGCDLYVGNSSMPLALAVGLGKQCVQEVSTETVVNAHTRTVFGCQRDWHPAFEWPEV
jgi:hypothetical protein